MEWKTPFGKHRCQKIQEGCGCPKFHAGKVCGKFRRCSTLLDIIRRFSGSTKSLPRFGRFPAKRMAAGKSASPSGTLSSETDTAFLSFPAFVALRNFWRIGVAKTGVFLANGVFVTYQIRRHPDGSSHLCPAGRKSKGIRKRHVTLKLAGPHLDAWSGARWESRGFWGKAGANDGFCLCGGIFWMSPTYRRHPHRNSGEYGGPSPELWWMSGGSRAYGVVGSPKLAWRRAHAAGTPWNLPNLAWDPRNDENDRRHTGKSVVYKKWGSLQPWEERRPDENQQDSPWWP